MGLNKRLFVPQDTGTTYAGYTSDLKVHYNAADSSSVSGTTFVDISGGANLNASLQGNASFNSGGWVDLDGSNDYINIPNNVVTSINSGGARALTISLWIYNTGSANFEWILGKGGQSGDWEYDAYVDFRSASKGFVGNTYYQGANNLQVDGRTSNNTWLTRNSWEMLTLGIDNANDEMKLWQGNSLLGTDTTASYPTTAGSSNSLHIGQRPDLNYDWTGRVNNIRIYEGIISQTTVNEIFAAGYQG